MGHGLADGEEAVHAAGLQDDADPCPERDRAVAGIEAEGCVMTPENAGAVLLRANLTQAELPSLIAGLQSQGRIEAPTETSLRILSDNCI